MKLDLESARRRVAFSPEQWRAVERAAAVPENSAIAEKMLFQDAEHVLDEKNPPVERAALAPVWGEWADMHYLLVYLCLIPNLAECYARLGLGEGALRENLLDLPIWMDDFYRKTGRFGLDGFTWNLQTFRQTLYRVGRLQYMPKAAWLPARVYRRDGQYVSLALDGYRYLDSGEAARNDEPEDWVSTFVEDDRAVTGFVIAGNGLATRERVTLDRRQWQLFLQPGDPVLEIHIPAGSPLTPGAVDASLAAAPGFFREHLGVTEPRCLVCASWLLDRALEELAPGSHVASFAGRFTRVPFASPYVTNDFQMFERVFGQRPPDLSKAPRDTGLRRKILDYYAAGKSCRNLAGYIPISTIVE